MPYSGETSMRIGVMADASTSVYWLIGLKKPLVGNCVRSLSNVESFANAK
jgi:hypothetical protein